MKEYHAHGKLLLTGEYLVLNGAKALATPLKKGQTLTVEEYKESGLSWRAETLNGLWFKVNFDDNLNIIKTTDNKKAENLQFMLRKCVEQNPTILHKLNYTSVPTQGQAFGPHR